MRCSARQDRQKNAVSTGGPVHVCKLSESIDLKKGNGGRVIVLPPALSAEALDLPPAGDHCDLQK